VWRKDKGGFRTMDMCKTFAMHRRYACRTSPVPHNGYVQDVRTAYSDYTVAPCADDSDFLKYTAKRASRHNRDGMLKDTQSIAHMSIAELDRNKLLFNCSNGMLNLQNFTLQPFNHADFITKLSGAWYDNKIRFPHWDRFIDEIMCGDTAAAAYLQKALRLDGV
jgi:phage/plasmid-associated DNA primase